MKIGIVGTGGMAVSHYEGFTKAGAEVLAVADPDLNRARMFGEPRGISLFYPSLSEMLAGFPELNAVSIITPNKFHKPLVIEALEQGKHVYCEKPPALNALETEEMLRVSKKTGRRLMFNFNNRSRPESQALMQYIQGGKVGKINSAQALWIRRKGIPGFGSWFTTKALSGGGAAIDLLHMLDLSLYFMGYPEPAYILGTAYYDFMDNRAFKGPWGFPDSDQGITDVESASHGFITFKTGQCLSLRSSWAELNEREIVSVTFQGSKAGGTVERRFGIDGMDKTSIDRCMLFTEEYGNQINIDIQVEKDESMGRVRNAENFIQSITGQAPALNTPEEALRLMKIIDGLYASAAAQEPIKIV